MPAVLWSLALIPGCIGLVSTKVPELPADSAELANEQGGGELPGDTGGTGSSGGSTGTSAVDDDGDGFTETDGDCDDRRGAVFPGAAEACNGRDDNCDGRVDEGDACASDSGGGGSTDGGSTGGGSTGGSTGGGTVDTGGGWGWDTGGGSTWDTGGGWGGGTAAIFLQGSFSATSGRFSSGRVGLGYYGLSAGSNVCELMGSLSYERAASSYCYGCSWSFDLAPITSSRASGSACSSLGVSSGDMDGMWDYAWAHATSYFWYDYFVFLENAVLIDIGGTWTPVAYNYPYLGIEQVYGTSSSFSFARLQTDSLGDPYYVSY